MKKIALAIEEFSKYKGGAESYAVSLASTLVEQGWEVHLFGRRWDGEPREASFHLIKVPGFLPSWAKMLLFASRHRGVVKRHKFDVILGFGNTTCMNVYQSHGGVHRYSTLRKVYSENRPLLRIIKRILMLLSIKDKARQWIESAPFRKTPRPRIVAISRMVKEDMVSFYKVPEQDIEVVYNGIDTGKYNLQMRDRVRGQLRDKSNIGQREIIFLFVSYDLKKKGIIPLIEASGKLKKSGTDNFKVMVLGGNPSPSTQRRTKSYHLEDTVIFNGSTKRPEEYYANSDVFVLPSFYDACSLAVLEAMACGLPVITTVYNGASGIITQGKEGYIISHPPDPEELADAMKSLFLQEKLKQMSQAAAVTGKRYSLEKNHREMLRIFNEAAFS